MNSLFRLSIPILIVALFSTSSFSWGPVGHRATGYLIEKMLNAKAREGVAKILGVNPEDRPAVAEALADAANWADDVARDKYPKTKDWHFLDLSTLNGAKDVPDPFGLDNTAFSKMRQYIRSIRMKQPDELEAGSDVKWLVHLMGDMHQPLHAATNQDRGGNCLFTRFDSDDQPDKLHWVWDSALIQTTFGSSNGRKIADRLFADYTALDSSSRAAIIQDFKLAEPSPALRTWIMRSHDLALSNVYGPLSPKVKPLSFKKVGASCSEAPKFIRKTLFTIPKDYKQKSGLVVHDQLIAAAARTAAIFNAIWPEH